MKSILFLITALASINAVAGQFQNCSESFTPIKGSKGYLSIQRNVRKCGFKTAEGSDMIAIRMDDLILKEGDSMQIISTNDLDNKNRLTPPLETGYFVSASKDAQIQFDFMNTDDTIMIVEFFQGPKILPINADVNNDFLIWPQKVDKLALAVSKTMKDSIHLEISGAKFVDSQFRHKLLNSANETKISIQNDLPVRVKTSAVTENCSGTFEDSSVVVIPDLKEKFKCVNIFATKLKGPAHFEADFKNFTALASTEDHIILEDSTNRVLITKSRVQEFAGQLIPFQGAEFALIYESAGLDDHNSNQPKINVNLVPNGGIISQPGSLLLPDSGDIRYVLSPGADNYAAIELNGKATPDLKITILSETKLVAQLDNIVSLPPIIALSDKNSKMVLKMSAKSYKGLQVNFKTLSDHCHRTSMGPPIEYSVSKPANPVKCIWLITSPVSVGFKAENINPSSSSTMKIQPISSDKPIYDNKLQTLPEFLLKQAYVEVQIFRDGQIDASFVSFRNNSRILNAEDKFDLKSPGYPTSYFSPLEQENYSMNEPKNYAISAQDLDLRSGEKFTVNGSTLTKGIDMLIQNLTRLTLERPTPSSDFGYHRGYHLTFTRFDKIVTANSSDGKLETPGNVSTLLVKIPSSKGRISYNITSKTSSSIFSTNVYDGRSLIAEKNRSSIMQATGGKTTSDTLLIEFRTKDTKALLPGFVIDHKTIPCNTTRDHICDQGTRCVPFDLLCKGISYCDDQSDLRLFCGSAAKIIETGVSGVFVFILSMLMLMLGGVTAIYGPDLYKNLESRLRSSQYSTFSSVE